MRRQCPLLVLLGVALLTASAHADITTGLIARYPFDGNASDASGNANHGTLVGGISPTADRFGNLNSAYQFNGLNSYVSIPGSPSLNSPTTAITQAAWILLQGLSQVGSPHDPIIMKSIESTNAFMYRMNAAPTYFGAAFDNWTTHLSATQTIPLNEWHHVATVFNGSSIRFYYDGVLVDTQAMALTIAQDTRTLTIGADFPGLPEYFNGKIDEVCLYSRALSDSDILELYGANTGVETAGPAPLIAYGSPFPNPSRDRVSAEFNLRTTETVHLSVYDLAGRRIRGLPARSLGPGAHVATWDGRDESGEPAPAGLYFLQLRAGEGQVSWRVLRLP